MEKTYRRLRDTEREDETERERGVENMKPKKRENVSVCEKSIEEEISVHNKCGSIFFMGHIFAVISFKGVLAKNGARAYFVNNFFFWNIFWQLGVPWSIFNKISQDIKNSTHTKKKGA